MQICMPSYDQLNYSWLLIVSESRIISIYRHQHLKFKSNFVSLAMNGANRALISRIDDHFLNVHMLGSG